MEVTGVAVLLDPLTLLTRPTETEERGLCRKEAVLLKATGLLDWSSVSGPSGLKTGRGAGPSIANRFIKFLLRWLCSQFIPSMKGTLYGIRGDREETGS